MYQDASPKDQWRQNGEPCCSNIHHPWERALGIATNVINDLKVLSDVILPNNPSALASNSVFVSVIKTKSHSNLGIVRQE